MFKLCQEKRTIHLSENRFAQPKADRGRKIILKGKVITEIPMMPILLEASRRIDEMPLLRNEIPSDDLIFEISKNDQEKEEIKFDSDESLVFTLVDGKRTVREIMYESGCDEFTVYKAMYSMVCSGLIEKSERAMRVAETKESDYAFISKIYCKVTREICKAIL